MEKPLISGTLSKMVDSIQAGYPIFYILTWEEKRVINHLQTIAESGLKSRFSVVQWSATDGFHDRDDLEEKCINDPLKAFDRILREQGSYLFIIKDLHTFILQDRLVIRKIRDCYQNLAGTNKLCVILSPILAIPPELQKEVLVFDYELPQIDEINSIIMGEIAKYAQATDKEALFPEKDREPLYKSFLGLTGEEIEHVARSIIFKRGRMSIQDADLVIEEKRQIIRKTEIVEFIQNSKRMADLGGLQNFKKWCKIRGNGFSDAASAFGLPRPKGILITGISGCGKSLAIQCLADEWNMPLIRLDMGRVFSGMAGTPEESLRRAILTVEAVAPAVLWIDEIEMGISVFSDSVESGSTARIFASFLTWMQEKKAPVFLAATANDIDRLPPEFIRKGRFDEVFFVDLPNLDERREVFRIHFYNRNKEVSEVSIDGLARTTNGYTGAEIEQAIISGLYEAFYEGREITMDDIYRNIHAMVPLSVTMKEQITKTRRWADNRALKAT